MDKPWGCLQLGSTTGAGRQAGRCPDASPDLLMNLTSSAEMTNATSTPSHTGVLMANSSCPLLSLSLAKASASSAHLCRQQCQDKPCSSWNHKTLPESKVLEVPVPIQDWGEALQDLQSNHEEMVKAVPGLCLMFALEPHLEDTLERSTFLFWICT